ncbi:hypothetical protein Bhyg_04654 [Pseudolycoriella hygida]|uniref:Uncharacterized protein n=1 Tax=Pseudolycoriella hygida TaxID=35572 RepID=A0A9Q0S8J2_9DIPT|nr:hypothetical protein Bhyg_04654 [Pseudolycoriella hygida]
MQKQYAAILKKEKAIHGHFKIFRWTLKTMEIEQTEDIEQIEELADFGIEFLLATLKQPAESMQVKLLLVDCFSLRMTLWQSESNAVVFRKIVNVIVANSSKKSLVNKIFDANLRYKFALVSMVLLERVEEKLPGSVWFLDELFALYLIDEATASECVSEIAKNGWSFNNCGMMRRLTENVQPETPAQTIFNFGKILLKNGINFLSEQQEGCALEILYSLEIPETLRNVLCFNYQNLKF